MLSNAKQTGRGLGYTAGSQIGSRPVGDFYASPEIAVTSLLALESFGRDVLEPACGNGAISRVLRLWNGDNLDRTIGYTVRSQDLHDWGYGQTGIDFLTADVEDVDAVITNPPFNLALPFAERALLWTKERQGKVALLLRLAWLEGQKRRKFFESSPLKAVYVFSKRLPRMHRFDFEGQKSTNMIAFAWFVWDWTWPDHRKPEIQWI